MTLTARGRAVGCLALLLVLVVVPGVGGVLYARAIGVLAPSDPGRPVEVMVPEGSSASDVGDLLEEAGVIRSSFGFRIAVFLGRGDEEIQAGRYELPTGLSARDALDRMVERGPVVDFVTVTFPEGSWVTEFADRVEEETDISGARFLAAATTGTKRSAFQPAGVDTLEGLLFPSTYQVIREDTARSLVGRLVDEFDKQARAAGIEDAGSLGVTPYEAIIVASMVEAEAKVPQDRARIAAVIYNRLQEGMQLGIDATVLYALGERKSELTQSDLAVDSPYNTRVVTGLPPTPIGAPGRASLEAAVAPADGDWLYFVVSDCEGHHAFSDTYDEFLEDKARYQALEC